ncbi:MAG TPA: DUF5709 domain-containing protein [Mycobacteriales bacterium]|nr:DUF5709 domain-containing protein [Mycobacteriales bacterium]
MTNRIPDPSDPFEDEGQASQEPGLAGKRITGDPQDDMPVAGDTPVGVTEYGTTAAEEAAGEPLDVRLSREEPDLLERAATTGADESEDADQPYPVDPEERVGRIVETDEGVRTDDEASAVANDVGTDQGGFTAEERAMHIEREV